MDVFKVNKEKKILQHKKKGEQEWLDLGVSSAEMTNIKERLAALEQIKEETLPLYKEYNLSYDYAHDSKLKELIDEAGIVFPNKATAFELFSNKLESSIKDALSTYKEKTGKHLPYLLSHIPLRFKVGEERVGNYYNQEGMNTERLGGVTYPFGKEVEVSFNPLTPIPIVTGLTMYPIPMFGLNAPTIYSYNKSLGYLFENAAPSYTPSENSSTEYGITYMNGYLTTMVHPTVTTRFITIDGNQEHYALTQNGVILSPVFKINGELKNGTVDTSVMANEAHINYWNNPTAGLPYQGPINAEILKFPKLEWYDFNTSGFKPAAMATIIPTNSVTEAGKYVQKMYVGLPELDFNERNSLSVLMGEEKLQEIVNKRREWNLSFANIYDSEAGDMTYSTTNTGEYPHMYVIAPIKLNTQEVLMLMDGYFPTGQAKAKYKITNHSHDMYGEMHTSEREEDIFVTLDVSVGELEVAEVNTFFGVGPKVYVHKIPMTYPEPELGTGGDVTGVSLLKVGPNALS